jgi:hypothetical protein
MVVKKQITKVVKLSKEIKLIKLSFKGSGVLLLFKTKGLKGSFSKPKQKIISLPKGATPMEVFHRPFNNTVHIKYVL